MSEASSIASSASRDFSQLPIETLLKLKKTFINKFEFEKAKKVQAAINCRKDVDVTEIINECKRRIDEKIDEIYADLQKRREIVITQYRFKELDISEKIDNAFVELQSRHIKELEGVEFIKAHAVARTMSKEIKDVKESRELLLQAKRLAENDDFDGAVKIREKAHQVKVDFINGELDQINQKYELMRKQAYFKQKNELQILTEKLKSAMEKNEAEKEEALKAQEKLAKVTIIYNQQKIFSEMTQKIKSKEKKLEMSEQINKFITQKVRENDENIVQASEISSVQSSQYQFSQADEIYPLHEEEEDNFSFGHEEDYEVFDNHQLQVDQEFNQLVEEEYPEQQNQNEFLEEEEYNEMSNEPEFDIVLENNEDQPTGNAEEDVIVGQTDDTTDDLYGNLLKDFESDETPKNVVINIPESGDDDLFSSDLLRSPMSKSSGMHAKDIVLSDPEANELLKNLFEK
ncbi:hypothetical protein TRFO_25344 [Tritrichomonas foetus]|uniref:Uncharacterized protein n=1 Tax=Tritrichomonas foetus TaxID=1144522 RepID=A0A1J4KAW1_9EUKA|nr:hypothetical protein TRFO_25344 [Tritrichomonas foetus]|eukprot:OHT06597.1 hypothetical protein TRFO_25344 [Tritrichomonas foetus]